LSASRQTAGRGTPKLGKRDADVSPLALLGTHLARRRSHAALFTKMSHQERAPHFGQEYKIVIQCNVNDVCRCGTIIGNNSRCLSEFFPILVGTFSVFDRPFLQRLSSPLRLQAISHEFASQELARDGSKNQKHHRASCAAARPHGPMGETFGCATREICRSRSFYGEVK
jgi:hypothetical protein